MCEINLPLCGAYLPSGYQARCFSALGILYFSKVALQGTVSVVILLKAYHGTLSS